MKSSPTWQYDEMKPVGKDYANVSEVEKYDAFHSQFRNIEKDNEAILNRLSVQKNQIVLEFGTGTGAFAIQAAKCCEKVYAVDVSQAMLDYAKNKAITNGVSNITFCHGGFLTYKHKDAPVDFVVTSFALHHRPDFWKAVALQRINSLLKKGGKLFLADVVFSEEDYMVNIAKWIAQIKSLGGKGLIEAAACTRIVYNWLQFFSHEALETEFVECGFTIDKFYSDVAGTAFRSQANEFAVVAKKQTMT